MVSRRLLQVLIYALLFLIVAFGVLMGGYALTLGMGDDAGSNVLWYVAMGSLVLLGIDLILLVLALALERLTPPE